MIAFPPCKINLGLHVVSGRPDGFHTIETCFYPVPLTDILEIIPAATFSFSKTGISLPGKDEENLCVKAYRLVQQRYAVRPVAMHLHKRIPAGAGLGGGSSDAAHVLRLLNQIFELDLTVKALQQHAAELGSDCAFFLHDKPMMGKGRGDVLSAVTVNLKGKFLIVIKPDVHVSTAEAYRNITPKQPAVPLEEIVQAGVAAWREKLSNDFEASVMRKHPVIGSIKEQLYAQGAIYAGMSGSGSAVYGIFEEEADLRMKFANHFYWSGFLN